MEEVKALSTNGQSLPADDGPSRQPTDSEEADFRARLEDGTDRPETREKSNAGAPIPNETMGDKALRGMNQFFASDREARHRMNAAIEGASAPGGMGILQVLELQAILLERKINDELVSKVAGQFTKTIEQLTNPR